MKTVRFAQVIAKSGKPETHSLWTSLEKDPVFKAALASNRIMTVHQNTVGSTADHGFVGYEKTALGTLLVFPRSLKSFANRRVVGIKYDLLNDPPETKPARNPKLKMLRKPKSESSAKPDPKSMPPPKPKRVFKKRLAPRNLKSSAGPQKESHQLVTLRTALKKAMNDLQRGKAVSAFQVLERALSSE